MRLKPRLSNTKLTRVFDVEIMQYEIKKILRTTVCYIQLRLLDCSFIFLILGNASIIRIKIEKPLTIKPVSKNQFMCKNKVLFLSTNSGDVFLMLRCVFDTHTTYRVKYVPNTGCFTNITSIIIQLFVDFCKFFFRSRTSMY